MPDAAQYGDEGTDTMGHISQNVDEFTIPNLQKLGIANLHPLKPAAAAARPFGYFTFLPQYRIRYYDRTLGYDGASHHKTV